MKRALKISLLVNVCLAALALWLARYARMGAANSFAGTTAASAPDAGSPPSQPIKQPIRERTTSDRPQRFQWGQLESSDYRTYIANLRAIGCPEQTIRDIITADVDTLYASRRRQLQQEQAGGPDPLALQTQLQRLQSEETGVLLALLGPAEPTQEPIASPNPVAAVPPIRHNRFGHALGNTEPMPLVFQDLGPEMKLNPAQREIINDLRSTFNDELKGLDPASEEYRQRWQQAQSNADQRMNALLGNSVWMEYLVKARNQHPNAPGISP